MWAVLKLNMRRRSTSEEKESVIPYQEDLIIREKRRKTIGSPPATGRGSERIVRQGARPQGPLNLRETRNHCLCVSPKIAWVYCPRDSLCSLKSRHTRHLGIFIC